MTRTQHQPNKGDKMDKRLLYMKPILNEWLARINKQNRRRVSTKWFYNHMLYNWHDSHENMLMHALWDVSKSDAIDWIDWARTC